MPARTTALLTIFGATGDLARRMLLPSLYRLHADGLLPPALRVLGIARTDCDVATFRGLVSDAVAAHVDVARPPRAAIAVAIHVITHPYPGLLGAAVALRRAHQQDPT